MICSLFIKEVNMYTLITVVIVLAIVVYSLKKNNEVESDPVVVEPTVEAEPVVEVEPVVEPVKKKRKPRKKKFFGLL